MSIDHDMAQEWNEVVLERVSDGVLVLDANGHVRYLNSAAVEMFELSPKEVVGEHIDHGIPALTESALFDGVQTALSEDSEVTVTEEFGSPRVRVEGTVAPSGDGVLVLLKDVTEREQIRQKHQRQASVLERLHDVASDLDYSRDEKIVKMLEIGTDHLGVRYGFMTHIEDETQTIVHSIGDHPGLKAGATAPLSETYCQYTLEDGETHTISDITDEGLERGPEYNRFGLECYLGVVLSVDGQQYGTVCFVDTDPRESGFDEHEQTFVELLSDWLTLMLERQSYERQLEHQQAFTESLLNSLPDPVYAFDEDSVLLRWNDRLEGVTGYSPAELDGMEPIDFVVASDRADLVEAFDAVLDGASISVEATLETRDGDLIPYEFSGGPLYDETDEIIGMTGVGRDMTEQAAHRKRLSRILETTRSLMQARDRHHVGELAANAAVELLDEEYAVFRLYDPETGTLEPIAMTPGVEQLMDDRPVYDIEEGYPGEVFASGEPVMVSDFDSVTREFGYGDARSAMYYPVGVHGTITVTSNEPNAFDETDQHILGLLATSAAAACMRAKRMQELREAREHTERVLDRVNGLVQNTVEELVHARTREELETGVVTQLAATEPYSFAWIGQPDVATEQLSPTAWDGAIELPVEGLSFDLNDGGPIATAYHDGTTQVIGDVNEIDGSWADAATESGVDAMLVVPLVYREATYGVLSVCAEHGDVFDERERIVLDALGRAVANAINAVERGRILTATEIIELEFAIDSPELLFNRLSADSDGKLEAVGTDYRSDGSVRLYLSAEDVDPGLLLERTREDPEVLDVTAIVEHETECLLELTVEDSLLAVLADYGAVTQDVVTESGRSRLTVELPYEAEARELFELVQQRYPGTDLLGYHERERPIETRQEFKGALSERLTERQATALRTAYLGGFFDWPRNVDGNELAEAMDISRPTYHQHLRTAQAKVFEELFE